MSAPKPPNNWRPKSNLARSRSHVLFSLFPSQTQLASQARDSCAGVGTAATADAPRRLVACGAALPPSKRTHAERYERSTRASQVCFWGALPPSSDTYPQITTMRRRCAAALSQPELLPRPTVSPYRRSAAQDAKLQRCSGSTNSSGVGTLQSDEEVSRPNR